MAEYKGFDASEKKKKKALEEGNTFKVPYFNQILYFSFLILSTYICITINYESKKNKIKQCVINPFNMLQSCIEVYSESLVLFCFLPMIISLILTLSVMGYNNRKNFFIWSLAKIDLKKVNPINGFKNFFGSFKDIWITCIKLALIAIFIICFLKNKITFLLSNFLQDYNLVLILNIFKNFSIYAIVVFFLGAIIEYFVKKRRYSCELSMSQDELKREYKEDEGDPLLKSERKHLHESLLMQKIEAKVRNSKVIIVD